MVNNNTLRPVVYTPQNEEENTSFLPMVHGKATDNIATMAGKEIVENPLNNTGSVTSGEVKLVISQFDKLAGTLGVSTHKLLSTAVASFTANNHVGSQKRTLADLKIALPLKEYALLCGYDVMEHDTNSPEDAKKEATRAENALKNARKKINKDLEIIFNGYISWSEKVRGKSKDYIDIRLITSKGIRKGYINLAFSPELGEYLVQLPLTQYPVALLRLDERNSNAYSMGYKMAEHFNIDNNQTRGTAQLLRVETLLNYTSLPSPDSDNVKKYGWKDRIKEPFENALDALTGCGLLKDWEYSHSKGASMTDEEATSFLSYEEWANTLVHFTLADAPDHTARIEARQEEKKQRQTAKKKSPKKGGKV